MCETLSRRWVIKGSQARANYYTALVGKVAICWHGFYHSTTRWLPNIVTSGGEIGYSIRYSR